MKKTFLAEIIMLLCTLILGISLVVWADKVTSIASIMLGIIAILYGVVACVNYFRNQDKLMNDRLTFIYGIVIMVMGFVLVFKVDFLKELISFIIGIYIIFTSGIKLHESIMVGKNLNVKLKGATILAIVGIIIGLLCIAGKFLIPDMIVMYIGIMLIIYSVISIVELILLNKK